MSAKRRNIWLLGLVSIILLAASFGAYLVGTYLVPTMLAFRARLENPLVVDEVFLRELVFSKGHLVGIGFHYLPPHMPRQYIRHEFDGREWTIGNSSADATQAISEMVTDGQTLTDWTEVVTGHVIFKRMPVEALVENFLANIDVQNCEDFRFEVVESSATTATITWSHAGKAGVPAQREIRRVFLGKDGMYNLSYTVKPEGYDPARFAKWLELISEAELVDRGDPQ